MQLLFEKIFFFTDKFSFNFLILFFIKISLISFDFIVKKKKNKFCIIDFLIIIHFLNNLSPTCFRW